MNERIRITVASDMEREDLFAEIDIDGKNWAEIINDPSRGEFVIEIFPPGPGETMVCELEVLREAIERAKQRLVKMGYPEKRASGTG